MYQPLTGLDGTINRIWDEYYVTGKRQLDIAKAAKKDRGCWLHASQAVTKLRKGLSEMNKIQDVQHTGCWMTHYHLMETQYRTAQTLVQTTPH